ncbi:pyruvate kinase [Planomonospora corallina]|uniref:Pyruvate kinase n=1 Tax=Planomonospora corallina TaxID=1806052 RepID=A0ABV8IH64_9ACTN
MSGNTPHAADGEDLTAVAHTVDDLRHALVTAESIWRPQIDLVHPHHRAGALNLAHYWAIRQHDLRDLQPRLAALGLSSLGRSEPRVQASLDAVARAIGALRGERPAAPAVPVPAAWLGGLNAGDAVTVRDTRAARRTLAVESVQPGGVLARTDRTVYLATGSVLRGPHGPAVVGLLPPVPAGLLLRSGDVLTLTADCAPAPTDADRPPRIGCTPPEVFAHLEAGQRVHLDDGKISGVIVGYGPDRAEVRITRSAERGTRLREAKGINLPDTHLPLSALAAADREHLRFVAEHADIVQMSFVRSARDVDDLLQALDECGDDRLGLIVKIESVQGFVNLPEILLAAMRRPHASVMIACGDLAVECGYERLAEVQEEILWLCEAAHLPVIWATQVLDQLARRGLPSRAEITDAAMGVRAECVMLNKGPHVTEAVDILSDILTRMSGHQHKKTPLLRPLRSWRRHPAAGSPRERTTEP